MKERVRERGVRAWVVVYSTCPKSAVIMPTSFRRHASSQFSAADGDNSGQLDRTELRAALVERGLPCSPVILDEFFARADRNGDGLIDKVEFMQFVNDQEREVRAAFGTIDKDCDGRLTAQELREGAKALGFRLSGDQVRSALQRADSNRDGTISFDELRAFLLLLPAVNPRQGRCGLEPNS